MNDPTDRDVNELVQELQEVKRLQKLREKLVFYHSQVRPVLRRIVCGLSYAVGTLSMRQAQDMYHNVTNKSGWHPIYSIDVGHVMDDIKDGYRGERYVNHPRFEEMVKIAVEAAADIIYDHIRDYIYEALDDAVKNNSTDEEKAHLAIQQEFGK